MLSQKILFGFLFISQIFLFYSYSVDPPKKPRAWTAHKLYKYLNETYLHKNNPNYDKNIKYFIFDPENYCQYEEFNEANDLIESLYQKYNVSIHLYFISHLKDKRHNNESEYTYAAYLDKLEYLIFRDHVGYNDNMTLAAIFFLKDNRMRIRTSRPLRKYIPNSEALSILNRRKKDLKIYNLPQVATGLIKEVMKTYLRKTENRNENLILMFTIIFIIGLTMLVLLLNKEQPSAQEDKVKAFLNKLKKKDNLKEIFMEACLICLDDFKSENELKEIEKAGNKENYEKEETSVSECGHKFHKKCIAEWLKKEEKCPLCKTKIEAKGNDDESKKLLEENINFNNLLEDILRIQTNKNKNLLNEMEVSRIRRIYYPYYRTSSSHSSPKSSNSSLNKKN